MRYYEVSFDTSCEDDMMCYCDDTYGIERYELKEGCFFIGWDERITFSFDPSEGTRATDYLANNLGWFIVSYKMKRVLDRLDGDRVQYFPVSVVNKVSLEKIEDYFVANILDVRDALNLEHSQYSVFDLDGEKIYSVHKYALNERDVEGAHVFKLKGDEIPIFVSEAFKDAVESEGLTGIDFSAVRVV